MYLSIYVHTYMYIYIYMRIAHREGERAQSTRYNVRARQGLVTSCAW